MKTVRINAKETPLRSLLEQAQADGVGFLTDQGDTRFVLAVADDADGEAFARDPILGSRPIAASTTTAPARHLSRSANASAKRNDLAATP